MSISTFKGDDGTTSLFNGERVYKDDLRIECLGSLDELSAFLGDARTAGVQPKTAEILETLEKELSVIMGIVAKPRDASSHKMPKVETLTELVQKMEAENPFKGFVVPGLNPPSAKLHIARTVCRRAERQLVALNRQEKIDPAILQYINRLSDLLYMLSREEEPPANK